MRATELTTADIGGETYLFDYMDTDVATEVFAEIGKHAAPIGAALVGGLMEKLDPEKIGDLEVADFLKTLANEIDFKGLGDALATSIEPKAAARIVATLCGCVRAGGSTNFLQGTYYKEHFKGRAGDALKVAIQSFKVNGGGHFFASAGGVFGFMAKKASTQAQLT